MYSEPLIPHGPCVHLLQRHCWSASSQAGSSISVQSQQSWPRASPVLLWGSLRHKTSQTWQLQYHNLRLTRVLKHPGAGHHNSSLEWRSVQQDQPGIVHAATWESTLHCPLPVLSPSTCHPSVQSWSCVTDTKGKILILMFKITMLKIDRPLEWILGVFLFTFLKKHQYCKELTG